MTKFKKNFPSQGKEIVKIKQENKALRESSVSNGDSSSGRKTFFDIYVFFVCSTWLRICHGFPLNKRILIFLPPLALSSEIKAVLDKHSVALEKQKENTTKLSKLCLGTLNELEKFEKKAEQVFTSNLS